MRDWLWVWLLVVVLEASRHLFLIKVRKVSPNKVVSFIIRLAAAVIIGYLDYRAGIRHIELLVLLYIFSGWFLHDVILAIGTGRKPWYLNNTGPIDKAQNSIGQTTAFSLKGLAAITLIVMYFINYA